MSSKSNESSKRLTDQPAPPSSSDRGYLGPPGDLWPTDGSSSHASPLRFVTVDHPHKLKDKAQMRKNRKHVMNTWLKKERQNPDSTDRRVVGAAHASKKRKLLDVVLPGASLISAPSNIHAARDHLVSPMQSATSSEHSSANKSRASRTVKSIITTMTRQMPYPARAADDQTPLLQASPENLPDSLHCPPDSLGGLPHPTTYIDSNLKLFDSWPNFQNEQLNLEWLKWTGCQNAGSKEFRQSLIPSLLKAKVAILSAMCSFAAHNDIMSRGWQAPNERPVHGSYERLQVRAEVIGLIKQSLRDPRTRTSDSTLVAVLNLLNSEIMGCEDANLEIHQQGLHEMIQARGGLDKLGADGQLSSILAIAMYLISALRESQPHQDFVRYAAQRRTEPSSDKYQDVPESPVFCGPSGFCTIILTISKTSPTFELLETLRLLTNSYVRGSGSSYMTLDHTNASWQECSYSVLRHHDKIFSIKPADDRPEDFSTESKKHSFEALRLVALAYAHALAHGLPFSKAAADLSRLSDSYERPPTTCPFPLRTLQQSRHHLPRGTSWHICVKAALIQTDLSDCWGPLSGTLFWLTLVAGACANPNASCNEPRRREGEEEEARKWLTAVAVRCSILLSFQHGGAILETLKRLVGIQQGLAEAEASRRRRGGVELGLMSGIQMELPRHGSARAGAASVTRVPKPQVSGPMKMPYTRTTF